MKILCQPITRLRMVAISPKSGNFQADNLRERMLFRSEAQICVMLAHICL